MEKVLVKNQLVEIVIEDIGTDGEGIGKADGYPLFVKGAVTGDRILARVLKAGKSYGYAKVERLLEPSKLRVTPVCGQAGRCGGCQLLTLSYEAQLAFKREKVKNCLLRIGGIDVPVEPVLGMEAPYHYRNKAQYPVGVNKEGRIITGFYAGRTHSIIETEVCAIQAPVNEALLAAVRRFMERHGVSAYNEETHAGLVRHVLTRVGFATGEIMVCLVINGTKLPHADELVKALKEAVAAWQEERGEETVAARGEGIESGRDGERPELRLKSVCLNINKERTNVILGETVVPLWGEPYITDYIGDVSYRISPLSFYQVNPQQTKVLYETALACAGLHGEETVWDLYCGIGTISLFLARSAKQVYGVEIVPQAVADAKANAARNGIANVEFFAGAAEEILPAKYAESNGAMRADVIVVDPPRKGCAQSLLETIAAMGPKRVVYVSCDPATLARDLKFLQENGYRAEKVCPVDMFPETSHVETVVLMSRVTK